MLCCFDQVPRRPLLKNALYKGMPPNAGQPECENDPAHRPAPARNTAQNCVCHADASVRRVTEASVGPLLPRLICSDAAGVVVSPIARVVPRMLGFFVCCLLFMRHRLTMARLDIFGLSGSGGLLSPRTSAT